MGVAEPYRAQGHPPSVVGSQTERGVDNPASYLAGCPRPGVAARDNVCDGVICSPPSRAVSGRSRRGSLPFPHGSQRSTSPEMCSGPDPALRVTSTVGPVG